MTKSTRSGPRSPLVALAAALGGVLTVALAPSPASAAVYRCVDAAGATTYTQTPCPVGASGAALRGVAATGSTVRDCRIARNFARRAASDMRAGATSGRFFDAHGGLDGLSPLAIGVANYVWTFRGDTSTSVDRIATLAADRCTADSFGPADCAQFPAGFIDGLGGCRAAAGFGAGVEDAWGDDDDESPAGLVADAPAPDDAAPGLRAALAGQAGRAGQAGQAGRAVAPAAAELAPAEACRARLDREIGELRVKMRGVAAPAELERLNELRRTLGRQRGRC